MVHEAGGNCVVVVEARGITKQAKAAPDSEIGRGSYGRYGLSLSVISSPVIY